MALTINGERVEDAEIARVREQLAAQGGSGDGPPEWEAKGKDLETFAKDMMIAQVLVRQEAQKQGGESPRGRVNLEMAQLKERHGGEEEFRKHLADAGMTVEQIRKDVELGLRVDSLLDDACAGVVEPTEDEARQYYDDQRDAFSSPEQVRVGHIVKHVEGNILDIQAAHSELKEVLARLEDGESFELLARRHSDCPENGGDLGYFARGAMVPEFEAVVFAMQQGEISGIFQTPYGLHIAKLHDRVPAQARPFDDVKDEVKKTLYSERENAAIDAFTDKLRAQATIEEA